MADNESLAKLAITVAHKHKLYNAKCIASAQKALIKEMKKLQHKVNPEYSFTINRFASNYNITTDDVRAILEDFIRSGWIVSINDSYSTADIKINRNLVCAPQITNEQIIQQLQDEIKTLKMQISLMPGGDEYLQAQKRFCDTTGSIPG